MTPTDAIIIILGAGAIIASALSNVMHDKQWKDQ